MIARNVIKTSAFCVVMAGALAAAAHRPPVLGQQGPGPANDAAFQLAKQMVGGEWVGTVGSKIVVKYRFHLEDGGNKIVGEGEIDADPKHPVKVRSSLGWDPQVKQVYYLDQHSYQTVYFGHVTREGDDLIFDFRALVGDTGHYRTREHLRANSYDADMSSEENGKWTEPFLHVQMHRK